MPGYLSFYITIIPRDTEYVFSRILCEDFYELLAHKIKRRA